MNRFIDFITEITEPVREFVISNHNKPHFWALLVFLGLIIFKLAYHEFSKH